MDRTGAPRAVEVDQRIEEAIEEAVKAGVFRRAARLNSGSATTWNSLAEPHSRRVKALTDGRDSGACARAPLTDE